MKFSNPPAFPNGNSLRWEGALHSIMNRLARLIDHRFHRKIQFHSFSDPFLANNCRFSPRILHSLLKNNSHVNLNNFIYLPIRVKKCLRGYAELEEFVASDDSFTPIDIKQIRQISELIDFIFISSLESIDALDELHRLENEIHLCGQPENVIKLSASRFHTRRQFSFSQENFPSFFDKIHEDSKTSTTSSCLIQGKTSLEIKKKALDFHQRSSRLLFYCLSPSEVQMKDCFSLLKELDSVTLFIPEIADLKSETVCLFKELLSSCRGQSKSFCIIFGTLFDPKDLMRKSEEKLRPLIVDLVHDFSHS